MLLHVSTKEKKKNRLPVLLAQEEQKGRFQILLPEDDLPEILKQKLHISVRVHQNPATLDMRPVVMVAHLFLLRNWRN